MGELVSKMGEFYEVIERFFLILVEDYRELVEVYPQYAIPGLIVLAFILVSLLVLAIRERVVRKPPEGVAIPERRRDAGAEHPPLERAPEPPLEVHPGEAPEEAARVEEAIEEERREKPPEEPREEPFAAERETEVAAEVEEGVREGEEIAPPPGEEVRARQEAERGEQFPPAEVKKEEPVAGEALGEAGEESEQSLFARLRASLSKTQAGLLGRLDEVISLRKEIDEDLWDEFEEALVMADVGIGTTMKLRTQIEEALSKVGREDAESVRVALREEILSILKRAEGEPLALDTAPMVIMVAGVNGVGKTTTIGKLAYRFAREGKTVMVAAADTFRAAAVEQLEIWASRVGSDFLRGQSGADPSAVAYDAVKAASARGTDVLIIDTAGRLHTKTNLMEELKKIRRVIGRELEGAPHETLLVLDATTGQNAIQQAKMFKDAIEVTGIVLTKLDGTAKGGVIVAIADELNIPMKFIGIGESLTDLRQFRADDFVEALFLTTGETIH